MRRRLGLLGIVAVVLVACGGDGSPNATPPAGPLGTVAGIGVLPSVSPSTPAVNGGDPVLPTFDTTVGQVASGPRLLLIGDSIFATVARRYNNKACRRLVPLGWQMVIEAEIGKSIQFGPEVLDAKLDEDWDAAVVFLGTNYWQSEGEFRRLLQSVLDDLEPRPTVLFTTSMYRPDQREVNDIIEEEARNRDNVWLVDWESISKADGVLAGDGIHPSTEGNDLLVAVLAKVLGTAPGGGAGKCLESEFVEDEEMPDAIVDVNPSDDSVVDDTKVDDTAGVSTDVPQTDPDVTSNG
ncbi:MAG: hypothetical protein RL391_970 [Actinomycetota bacterium]|jgi:hypothetical protein